jgi:hypothetical protein
MRNKPKIVKIPFANIVINLSQLKMKKTKIKLCYSQLNAGILYMSTALGVSLLHADLYINKQNVQGAMQLYKIMKVTCI